MIMSRLLELVLIGNISEKNFMHACDIQEFQPP